MAQNDPTDFTPINLEPGESKKFKLEVPMGFTKGLFRISWTCGGCGRNQTLHLPVSESITDDINANICCYICDAPAWKRPYRRLLYRLAFKK